MRMRFAVYYFSVTSVLSVAKKNRRARRRLRSERSYHARRWSMALSCLINPANRTVLTDRPRRRAIWTLSRAVSSSFAEIPADASFLTIRSNWGLLPPFKPSIGCAPRYLISAFICLLDPVPGR